jgi:hypothetical protein
MRANLEKKSGVSSILLAGELLHILEFGILFDLVKNLRAVDRVQFQYRPL